MKVLGIIAEYNPFHNGHLYHLNESKRLSGADFTVCVMSGNFIQRGEPAIVNKWARARMALSCGIDLVLELPVVYAMSSAEYFGYSAVKILDSLGIVDFICFGSENGKIGGLDLLADILVNEPPEYKSLLKKYLDSGSSFPSARESAIKQYLKKRHTSLESVEHLLGLSNNILGIEYLKALKKLKSQIKPLTVTRTANLYNSEQLSGSISSATSIRKHILSDMTASSPGIPAETMPEASLAIMKEELDSGRGPVHPASFEDIILHGLRRMQTDEIGSLPYVSEGLENRIKESAEASGSLDELIDRICTRRYTRTRIQRALFSLLTRLGSRDFESFNEAGGPQYIRVLGFTDKGRRLLSDANKTASLPLIIKTANFKNTPDPLLNRMLAIEAFSTDAYVLGYKNPAFRKAGQEFTQNVIRYKG